MLKRIFDISMSVLALIVLAPLMLLAAIGIKLTSPGPVIYKAQRAGRNNSRFVMYKFRTMHVVQNLKSSITAHGDPRIFPFGSLLRKLKIDELPQLFNIVLGHMSIVGPRPEAADIVDRDYQAWMMETLDMAPGLASPGSIFGYTHGEEMIGAEDPEGDYRDKLLPIKLSLELIYVRNAGFFYDLQIIVRTVIAIIQIALGKKDIPHPPEYGQASEMVAARAG